jgi:hypothetical protein
MNQWLRRLEFNAHLGLFGLLVRSAACTSKQACDGQGRAAIEASLQDAVSGAPVCDGSVHLVGQDTDEIVSCFPDAGGNQSWCGADCSYVLYAEPSRNYTVQASAAGYAGASMSVYVPSDDCGKPVTQQVTLELQPN